MAVKVVLACGNFDPLHVGHVRHLESARRLGDLLLVSVAPDYICKLKGDHRPYFPASERVEFLNGLACVTLAFESESFEAIRLLKPVIYVKGPECRTRPTPRHQEEIDLVRSYGGQVVYTDDPIYSSTALMERVLSNG